MAWVGDQNANLRPSLSAGPHDPFAPIRLSYVQQQVGGGQHSASFYRTTRVSMIVDDQLHTMPMKFGQGLQQAIYRGAEVVQGLDNDRIDLAPDNGTINRSQPWQPVPALRDAGNAIYPDGDDRPATGEVDQEVIGPGSTRNSGASLSGAIR